MNMKKLISLLLALSLLLILGSMGFSSVTAEEPEWDSIWDSIESEDDEETAEGEYPEITVKFGYVGREYVLLPEDNETVDALVRNITEYGRNLPLYDYENYEHEDVLIYYDIPSYYSIPAEEPELVTEEKAGDIYFSAPDRIIMFYQDAEISGMYTKIGTLKDAEAEDLKAEWEANRPLDYWDCKVMPVFFTMYGLQR